MALTHYHETLPDGLHAEYNRIQEPGFLCGSWKTKVRDQDGKLVYFDISERGLGHLRNRTRKWAQVRDWLRLL